MKDLRPGVSRLWRSKGVWNCNERVESMRYRELKEIRLLLMGSIGKEAVSRGHKDLLMHVENQAVVHITN